MKQYHGVTVSDLYDNLNKKFNFLVDEILRYESDTFSSEVSELTPKEAERVAFVFVLRDIENRTDTKTMDGLMISELLEEMREIV